MISVKIENIKLFMSKLFVEEIFDRFHVSECDIITFFEIRIDGRRQKEWYDTDEQPDDGTGQLTWREMKPIVYQLIRGKRTPQKMRIDFCHQMTGGDIGSLRVEYDRESLVVYTGYMQREFSLDKQKQQEWDDYCHKFLREWE